MTHGMQRLAKMLATAGGLILCATILMTCLSVALRELGVGPIPGDYELVQAGVGFAIFAFLPWCHITHGHASVDIFAQKLPAGFQHWFGVVVDCAFAAVIILITWRMGAGLVSKYGYGETTFILGYPIWWAYAGAMVGAVAASITAVYVAVAGPMARAEQ